MVCILNPTMIPNFFISQNRSLTLPFSRHTLSGLHEMTAQVPDLHSIYFTTPSLPIRKALFKCVCVCVCVLRRWCDHKKLHIIIITMLQFCEVGLSKTGWRFGRDHILSSCFEHVIPRHIITLLLASADYCKNPVWTMNCCSS